MKAFVIGADGFLGGHVVRQLLAQNITVRAMLQAGSKAPGLDGLDIERVERDLLDDVEAIADSMEGCDVVLHLAAITDMWADAEIVWQVNYEGTRRVLDACLQCDIKRLVFCGSASSYHFGSMQNPGDETSPYPDAYKGLPYMESKYRAMELVKEYVRNQGLDAVIVAPTFMLGDLDFRPSSGELLRQFVKRRMASTSSGGRNFACVSDVAEAVVAAIEKGRKGESYILGGHNLTYLEFFRLAGGIIGVDLPRRVIPGFLLKGIGAIGSLFAHLSGRKVALNYTLAKLASCKTYYSSEKAQNELGLKQTPIEKGITDSFKSLISCGYIYEDERKNFEGKVALVTGASRGVGFSIAREFVKRGAKVLMSARGEKRLKESAKKLEALGGEVAIVTGDVGQIEDAKRMVDTAREHLGPIHFLVNNAGVSMRGRFNELTPDVAQNTIQTNLMGSIYPTLAAIEDIRRTRGNVVFISSIAGLFGLPGASTYCAGKAALTGLSESLRLELLPEGVHSGVVYLGFTEHDPEKRILAADGKKVLPDRPAHHTQAFAASLVVEMINKRKRKIIMTPAGVIGGLVYRIAPWFVEWAILKAQASQIGTFKKFS